MSNKNFDVILQVELSVKFTEPSKAKQFFLDGDWKRSFYDFSGLNDLADHIAWGFHQAPQSYGGKVIFRSIEGFPDFKRDDDMVYISEDPLYGAIIISIKSQLDVV